MPDPIDTLITGDVSKLPPDIAALLDPAVPLPADTAFFEKRFTIAEMIKRVAIAGVLVLVAVVMIPLGIATIIYDVKHASQHTSVSFWPLGVGVVFAFGAWIMLASLTTCWRLSNLQSRGQPTRRGTFLTPAALVQASDIDTTVIPPSHFVALSGAAVQYKLKDQEKSFRLPDVWLNATPQQVDAAIKAWAARAGSSRSPGMPPPLR